MKLLILPRSAVQGRKNTRVFLEDGTELENVSMLSVGYYNDVSELNVLDLRHAIPSSPERLKSIALEFADPQLVEISQPPPMRPAAEGSAHDLLNAGHGIDIQRRMDGTGWPKSWRVRLIWTKNERADFRIEAFGDTMQEALDAAQAKKQEAEWA